MPTGDIVRNDPMPPKEEWNEVELVETTADNGVTVRIVATATLPSPPTANTTTRPAGRDSSTA